MTNREKYAEQILDIACSGRLLAVKKRTLKPIACENTNCEKCYFGDKPTDECITECKKWCNAEYVAPSVDWRKVPVDTPILVRDREEQEWIRGYFATYGCGLVYAWSDGKTSWSASNDRAKVMPWEYAKLAEDGEQ